MTRKNPTPPSNERSAKGTAGQVESSKPDRSGQATRQILDSSQRLEMIRHAAYLRAARRQFAPGHEQDDWLAAEQEVDATLAGADLPPARLIGELERERDELRLKVHLAGLEIRQEWDELEKKWQQLKHRSGRVADQAVKSGKDIGAAARNLAGEIRRGYQHIRKSL